MIFAAGFVAAIQLANLLPTNALYVSSWDKFGFTLLLSVFFSSVAWEIAESDA